MIAKELLRKSKQSKYVIMTKMWCSDYYAIIIYVLFTDKDLRLNYLANVHNNVIQQWINTLLVNVLFVSSSICHINLHREIFQRDKQPLM